MKLSLSFFTTFMKVLITFNVTGTIKKDYKNESVI
jgi:hypothetical protein